MGHHQRRKSPLPTQALIKLLSLLPNFDKRRARKVCHRWMIGLSRKFDQLRHLMWPMDAENSSILLGGEYSSLRAGNTEEATSTPFGVVPGRSRNPRSRFYSSPQLQSPQWSNIYSRSQSQTSQRVFRDLSEISRQMVHSQQSSYSACSLRHRRQCYSRESFPSAINHSRGSSNQYLEHSSGLIGEGRSARNSPATTSRNRNYCNNNYIALPEETQRDRQIRYSPSDRPLRDLQMPVAGTSTDSGADASGTDTKRSHGYHSPLPPLESPGEVALRYNPSDYQYGNSAEEIVDTLATGLEHSSPNQYATDTDELESPLKSSSEISTANKTNTQAKAVSTLTLQQDIENSYRNSEENKKYKYFKSGKEEDKSGTDISTSPLAKYQSQSRSHLDRFADRSINLHSCQNIYSLQGADNNNVDQDYEYRRRTTVKEDVGHSSHPYRSAYDEEPTSSYPEHSRQSTQQNERISRPSGLLPVQRGRKPIDTRFSHQPHRQEHENGSINRKHHQHPRGQLAHHLHLHPRQPGFNQADVEKYFVRNNDLPLVENNNHDGNTITHSQQIRYHHVKARKDDYSKIGNKSKKIVITKRRPKKKK